MNQNFDVQCVGEAFLKHYYEKFDLRQTRGEVINLYSPDAMLTFEGERYFGTKAVSEKLTEKFQIGCIKRIITKVDCQPLSPDSLIIFVLGQLVDYESQTTDKPMGFSQVFVLKANGPSFMVTNEMFRLTLHDFAA